MKHNITVTAITLAVLVVGAWAYYKQSTLSLQELPQHRAASSHAEVSTAAATDVGVSEHPQASRSSKGDVQAKPAAKTIKQMMSEATDLFAFAKSILARAKAGDPAAQYALYWVHFWCGHAAGQVSQDHGRALTWDEALQKATSMHMPMDKAKEYYDQCHRFFSEDASDLGDAMVWLQRATDQGYPDAQVTTAQLRLQQDSLRAFQRAGAVPTGDEQLPPIGGDAQPRDLLRAAVQSLDPQIIQQVGMIVNQANPNAPLAERQVNGPAWIYVSCLRGADCSYYGPPDKSYCAATDVNCVGVPQKLLEWNQYNWEPIQQRANEINAALNAGQWDKLGLGP